jgi:hypothetical protein
MMVRLLGRAFYGSGISVVAGWIVIGEIRDDGTVLYREYYTRAR